MKRLFILVISLIFSFSVCGMAFAAPVDKVLYEQQEIKDLNVLWDRANQGIKDDNKFNFKSVIQGAPIGYDTEDKVTVQKLKEVQLADGKTETSYAATVFSGVKKPKQAASLNFDIRSLLADSKSWNEGDPATYSVQHVSTFYYNSYIDSQHQWKYVQPLKISSTWYRNDSSVAITNSNFGAQWEGSTDAQGSSYTWVKDSDYTYLGTPSIGTQYTKLIKSIPNLGYVNVSVAGGYVVFQQNSSLKRNGSSWNFTSAYKFTY